MGYLFALIILFFILFLYTCVFLFHRLTDTCVCGVCGSYLLFTEKGNNLDTSNDTLERDITNLHILHLRG